MLNVLKYLANNSVGTYFMEEYALIKMARGKRTFRFLSKLFFLLTLKFNFIQA